MKEFSAHLIFYFLASIFYADSVSAEETETIQSLLAAVSLQDGVNKFEAENIAKAYFRYNIGCGYFKEVTDSKNDWVVEGGFGYSGTPIKGFLINKKTGSITSPVGPSYKSPFEIPSET